MDLPPPPLPPRALPLRCVPESVARWFRIYGLVSLPAAAWLAYQAVEVAGTPIRGGSPCTGPVGVLVQWGLVGVLIAITGGLLTTGVWHFIAAQAYLAERESTAMTLVCVFDGVFWTAVALVVGTGFGVPWLALFVLLALVHFSAAWLYVRRWNPSVIARADLESYDASLPEPTLPSAR